MSLIKPHSPPHRALAKGSLDPNGHSVVACRFDEDLFEAVRILAASQNISFAEQVRRFCLVGLAERAKRLEDA